MDGTPVKRRPAELQLAGTPKMLVLPFTLIQSVLANRILFVQQALAEPGVDIDGKDTDGNTAVHLAKSSEILALLLGANPDLTITNNANETAAEYQTNQGRGDLARHIDTFASLADVEETDDSLANVELRY